MLHRRKIVIVSSGSGDCVYVVFVHNVGYVRKKSAWIAKPVNVSKQTDYYDMLVEMARKVA